MAWRGRAWTAAPYALAVAAAIAVTARLFTTPGIPYNVDISGFFPLSPEAYEGRFWPLWNERGGMSTLQFLPALLFELPLLVLGRLLSWDMAFHVKLRILLGLVLAGVGMVALVRHYLARSEREGASTHPLVGTLVPLVAALFYMLNPWSVHRVFHYFLWLGYVLAPFVVLAFEHLAARPSWRRALLFALVFALATTDPHNPPYLAIILIPLGLLRVVEAWRRSRREAGRLLGHVTLAGCAYLLAGAFWILPYVWNALHNPGFGPTYVMSEEMLGTLSRGGDFWSVLRLTHNYLPRAPLAPEGGVLLTLWQVASLAVPILALNALLLRPRSGTVWVYAGIAAGSILLGMGDNPPFTAAYRWLLFGAPWGEGLSWLFRDPYRWGGFQALGYAVLMAFTLHEVGKAAARVPARLRVPAGAAAPVLALACVALMVTPAVGGYMGGVFTPVEIPDEYPEANAFLASQPESTRVLWMPRMLGATTWGGERTLAYFDATSSGRGALGPFRPHTSTYFNFLGATLDEGAPVAHLFARAGTEMVMFHNDRDPNRDAKTLLQLRQAGFDQVGVFGETPVSVVDQSSVSPTGTPGSRYAVYGERSISQTFGPTETDPETLDLRVQRVGAPGPLLVEIYDSEGDRLVSRNLTLDEDAREARIPLGASRLIPGEVYLIHLSTYAERSDSGNRYDVAVAGDAENRYDVSYYKVDAYPQGQLAAATDGESWRNLTGDLYFEVRGQTPGFVVALDNPAPAPRFRASGIPVASPSGLGLLTTLAALPEGSPLRESGVLFTESAPATREAFTNHVGPVAWVADLDAGILEVTTPFLPEERFLTPFTETTTADGKTAWARGTREYSYYEWGWINSLRSLKQKSWEFDGGTGLVYTSADASLTVPLGTASAEARTLLVRAYFHPSGGNLTLRAGDAVVGTLDTRAPVAGFRWVEVGTFDAGATTVTLENRDGFQGVSLLAAPTMVEMQAARDAAAARLRDAPIALLAEGERIPGLATNPVALPGVGKLGRVMREANATVNLPAAGNYTVWLHVASSETPPALLVDGVPVTAVRCVDGCGPAPSWMSYALGDLPAGAHTLTLRKPERAKEDPLVDALAVTNAPQLLTPATEAPTGVAWERVSPTEYRVHVNATGPFLLTFAEAYDAGWSARVHGRDGTIQSVMTDGVVNGFLVDAQGPVTLTVQYDPQEWAEAGLWLSSAALLGIAGLLVPWGTLPLRARRRAAANDAPDPDSAEEAGA